jgi:hypothetical protein
MKIKDGVGGTFDEENSKVLLASLGKCAKALAKQRAGELDSANKGGRQ